MTLVVREHVERKASSSRARVERVRARVERGERRWRRAQSARRQELIKLDLGRPVPATHDPWTRGDAFEIEFECESTASRA